MASYVFKVGTPEGQVVEKQVEAADVDSAEAELRRQGLHVFAVRARARSLRETFGRRKISTERFLLFNQELLALVRAGLPIVQSLDIMLERQEVPQFRKLLAEIRDRVRSGVALSDAFAEHGDIFPPIYSNSLRAGERSGDLEGVIRRFLRYQKLIANLQKKIVAALIYPSVLLLLSIGMIAIMLVYVIPKFSEFYAGFDQELPPFTRLAIGTAFFVRNNVVVVAAAFVALILAVRLWSRTERGGIWIDRIKLGIPIAGQVLHSFSIMQFAQSLGTLLGGGTPMVPALETAAGSVTNRHVALRLRGIPQRVREGEPLWHSLEATGVMTNISIEMIKVGEATGALVEMLSNVSEFYDEEIETKLNRMMTLLEPVILVILGAVIAALLYAFYLPLFEITKVQNV